MEYSLELTAQPSDTLRASLETFFVPPGDSETSRALGARALTLHSLHTSTFIAPPLNNGRSIFSEGSGAAVGRYMTELGKIQSHKFGMQADKERAGVSVTGSGDGKVWLSLRPTLQEQRAIVQPPLFEKDQSDPDLGMYFIVDRESFVGEIQARVALDALLFKIKEEDKLLAAAKEAAEAAANDFDDLNSFGPRVVRPTRQMYLTQLAINVMPTNVEPPAAQPHPDAYRHAA